jgi:5,10-methylenetetrahydromethanopterin reductase
MIKTGIHIVPTMQVNQVIDLALAAEGLGYEYCLIADEGFMPDAYVSLGAIARQTNRIELGPVTNGYTRHPAVTASALATLNELSGGRVLVTIVAGGSMVLPPMGIAQETPLTVVKETIEIMRQLWTGDTITWQGRRYRLDSARSAMGQQDIPIWLAGRGPKMLALAGAYVDGVVLTIKSDLGAAIEIVEQGVAQDRRHPERIYLGNLAYTPEMLDEVVDTMVYVIKDAPSRVLKGFGLTDETIANIRQAVETGGPPAAARFITPDMLKKYQIAGTPAECSQTFREMVNQHNLDVFLLDIVSPDFKANLDLVRNTRSLITQH